MNTQKTTKPESLHSSRRRGLKVASNVPLITLTTDFGTRDWFVGTMKGVILAIAPRVAIVDLTHEIPPGDIRAGAFTLMASCRFFPKGTIHVAVIDPGVGSARAAIAVQTANYFFVAPNNGVLSWVLAKEKIQAIHALENHAYFLKPVSRTFHGRDIFSPAAAHLSRGVPIGKLGPALKDLLRLPWPEPRHTPDGVQGEIVYLDRFGNAITNIDASALPSLESSPSSSKPGKASKTRTKNELSKLPGYEGAPWVYLGRKRLCPLAAFYQAVPRGEPVAVLGSSGFLEIAINGGNAAQRLRLRIGDRMCLQNSQTNPAEKV